MSTITEHSIDFSLKFGTRDRLKPLLSEKLRIPQVIFDLPFNLALWHNFIEGWFWLGIFLRPNSMAPIDLFNRALIGDALGEGEHSATLARLRLRSFSEKMSFRRDQNRDQYSQDRAPAKESSHYRMVNRLDQTRAR